MRGKYAYYKVKIYRRQMGKSKNLEALLVDIWLVWDIKIQNLTKVSSCLKFMVFV